MSVMLVDVGIIALMIQCGLDADHTCRMDAH